MAHAVARDAFWDQAEEQEANTWGMTGRLPTACYGSSAQGGAARKLLKEAATETRPNEKTKGILENFTRQRDLGQTTTSARPKSTADARVHVCVCSSFISF